MEMLFLVEIVAIIKLKKKKKIDTKRKSFLGTTGTTL